MEATLRISLQQKQREALNLSDKYPVFLYGGAKGGGKSYLVRARETIRRLKYPGSKGLIVRKTYPELLSNHIRPFFTEYPIVRDWFNKSEKAIYWPNGSITEFSYLQNTDDVYTYQGREYEDITIDEVTQHEEEVVKILRSSNRTTRKDVSPRMFLTGNPGGPGHGFIQRVFIDRDFTENENPDDFGFLQAMVYDNTALMEADPGYIKRLQDLPEDLRRAYLEGDWTIFSGQFFSEFRKEKHVIRPFIPKKDGQLQFFGGMDWGRTAPFAFLMGVLQKTKLEGVPIHRVFIFSEVYGTQKNPAEWAEIIKKRMSNFGLTPSDFTIYGDPAMFTKGLDNSVSIASQFFENGVRIKPASNDRIGGWVNVHDWLSVAPDGRPYLLVTEQCENLIRTLPKLIHDDHQVEDVDTTGEDHAPDALRYLLKALKWLDARSGGIKFTEPKKRPRYANMKDTKQVGIDLGKFAVKWGKK